MSGWITQHLQSYELAGFAGEILCDICEQRNPAARHRCFSCGAPLGLRCPNDKRKPPQVIGVLGAAAAGKTSFLGMLTDILSREDSEIEILARGAYSVALQQDCIDALARRRFPERTRNQLETWNWVHCQLARRSEKKQLDLVLPDIASSMLESELDEPGSAPLIRGFLQKCAAAMLLVDAGELAIGNPTPTLSTMKCINYLAELAPDRKRGWLRRPVAIVFTKAEGCETCFDDPATFCRERAGGLWRLCQHRLARHRFFATTLVGRTARVRYGGESLTLPLRIEPREVTEPFRWLVQELES